MNTLLMPYFHYCSFTGSNTTHVLLSKTDEPIKKVVDDASVFLGNCSIYNMTNKATFLHTLL